MKNIQIEMVKLKLPLNMNVMILYVEKPKMIPQFLKHSRSNKHTHLTKK